ncbi:uncharacterized protein LOC114520297 [Dendronephthya gigantea]|uniref:uncharacterized protein LOC114520297 n=1 Tax=Dendronephthya gigantea TaxID=151771 RepID=UPI00106CB21B|nr:uncharacterized protein LOC114520297 [Dendronephthya gigantea]XP_028396336.1 uncharacterized protein LOC114520297 [Dendronephthya gigantea]
MKNRKRIYVICMIAIILFLLRSFPKMDISTWSLLLMNDDEADFLRTWARIQRTQLDVTELLGSCTECVEQKCRNINPHEKTDVKTSYISKQVIQPSGDFSRVYIKTKNANGSYRVSGGDGWQVYFKGPSYLTSSVFDLGNGTYEVVFLPVVPGEYKLYAYLIYTACSGVRRPPEAQTSLGKMKYHVEIPDGRGDTLLHRLQYHMKFRDCYGTSSLFQYQRCYGCCRGCRFVWNGLGTWENVRGSFKWRPYIKIDDRPKKVKYRKRAIRKNGTLWFFGDPQARIYNAVSLGPLCSNIFKNCENASLFYPSEDLTKLSSSRITDLVLNSLRTLLNYSLWQPQNALILNAGFIKHLPYHSYTRLISQISHLLQDTFNNTSHAQVIWSTLMPPATCCSLGYRIYNAFTNKKLCKANVPILDLFSLMDSQSHSLNKDKLRTNSTLESVERLLVDYFELTADK